MHSLMTRKGSQCNSRIAIEQAPLQTYISALILAPKRSITRNQFEREIPNWIIRLARVREVWGALLEMIGITAEQMVFLDESLFNETTGWRLTAWAPIGNAARYTADMSRRHSWSLLAAYSINGYLPGWLVKQGYHDTESFLEWINISLLPNCQPFPGPNSVIIMDNVSIHCDLRVSEAILAHGCLIRYLPPYSPDFNPIEMSFSVLKSWIRRRFDQIWPSFVGTFGRFVEEAVKNSQCDRFAAAHFRHAGNGGYVFEGHIEALDNKLQQYEYGRIDELE
jgi:transposase